MNMKKRILLLFGLVLFIMLLSCNRVFCPTYSDVDPHMPYYNQNTRR